MTPMADYVREANRETFVLIQLEDPAAVDQAEAVAAVPGVDMIMLGPADFTVLTGIPASSITPPSTPRWRGLPAPRAAPANTGRRRPVRCSRRARGSTAAPA